METLDVCCFSFFLIVHFFFPVQFACDFFAFLSFLFLFSFNENFENYFSHACFFISLSFSLSSSVSFTLLLIISFLCYIFFLFLSFFPLSE